MRPGFVTAEPSFAQQRVFAGEQLYRLGAVHTVSSGLLLRGRLDPEILGAALSTLAARHEMLRTAIELVDGRAILVIHDDITPDLVYEDLRDHPVDEARRMAWQRLDEAQRRPFDLAAAPLWRAWLIDITDDESNLLLTLHHIVVDGWSLSVLWRELGVAYDASLAGTPVALDPLPVSYSQYAAQSRLALTGERLDRLLAHWVDEFTPASPELELPLDRPRPRVRSYDGAGYRFELRPDLVPALRQLAERNRSTVFMVLLAVFARLLAAYGSTEDVVAGVPMAGRDRPESRDLVGLLVNPLPLRMRMSPAMTVDELVKQARRVTLAAISHQELPFDRLVQRVAPRRDPARHPLFPVLFSVQPVPTWEVDFPTVLAQPLPTPIGPAAEFELNVLMHDTGDRVRGLVEYSPGLFDADTITRLVDHFQHLLADAVRPGARLAELAPCTPLEHARLVGELAGTIPAAPAVCVHTLVERFADVTADAVALSDDTGLALTYADLDARANAFAADLVARGVGPERLVAICLPRGPDLIVTMLAVLKAGGAYLPLDPAHPPERRRRLLDNAAPHVVVSAPAPASRAARPAVAVRPGDLAYVTYTSGSTGSPKGVMVTHAGLANLVSGAHPEPILPRSGDVVGLRASIGFDALSLDVWSTLCAGARLHLAPAKERLDPADYRTLAGQVSVLHLTPGVYAAVADQIPPLRQLMLGGDRIDPAIVPWSRDVAGLTTLNLYGPTEATIAATAGPVLRVTPFGRVPIGRPLGGVRVYLLDHLLRPVPVGVRGEMYIGGAGVARGYLGAPGLTATRFVASPFGTGERLYRTGDLARRLDDGALEFLGRADDQIKLRGVRIEPAEVETVLREHPGVRSAVAVVRDDRLVAYVVGTSHPDALLEHLQGRLPAAMVPGAVVTVPSLPLTPNGKLDLAALPPVPAAGRSPACPHTPTECLLAEVWQDALDIDDIGLDDDFFELGGDSILALQVVNVLEGRGVALSVADLYQRATLRGCGAFVDRKARQP